MGGMILEILTHVCVYGYTLYPQTHVFPLPVPLRYLWVFVFNYFTSARLGSIYLTKYKGGRRKKRTFVLSGKQQFFRSPAATGSAFDELLDFLLSLSGCSTVLGVWKSFLLSELNATHSG